MPPNDVALSVGLDHYATQPLPSCVNDATKVGELLARHGDREARQNYTVDLLVPESEDEMPTRQSFLLRLQESLDSASDNDYVFYYSGHGATHTWGTELVVNDAPGTERVSLNELAVLIDKSRVRQAVVILDACFSGAFAEIQTMGDGRSISAPSLLRTNLMLLAAARPLEPALAGSRYSAFTELLIAGLEGGAADHNGDVTAPALFGYAAPAFGPLDQRPTFKANLSVTYPLRQCEPAVGVTVLRRLANYFPRGTDSVQLDPNEATTSGSGQSLRYRDFVMLREAGLIRCSDHRHLADHAADAGSVTLTPAGARVRTLAVRDKI